MSEIKTMHKGGDSAKKPSVNKSGHPMQKPGVAAGGDKLGKMNWTGKLEK